MVIRFFRHLVASALLVLATTVFASPTSADFKACHGRASAILQKCLDRQPGQGGDACWVESRDANRACYEQVREVGSPPSEEEKRRIEEAMRKAKSPGEKSPQPE